MTAALIAAAVLLRVASYRPISQLEDRWINLLRTAIYAGIILWWGLSVYRRIMQQQLRLFMTSAAIMMVFWIVLREIKYRYAVSPDLIRHLWYLYYLPLLTIPLLSFYSSLFPGKPENYRISRGLYLLFIPGLAILLMVLTNDLHELAFSFPPDLPVRSEAAYSYGPVYYMAIAWILGLSVLSLVNMIRRSVKPMNKAFWIPLVPIAVAVIYTVFYVRRAPFVMFALRDVAVFICLCIAAFFECCIQTGLIQSNSRYRELFEASADMSLGILNDSGQLCYGRLDPRVNRSQIEAAQKEAVKLGSGTLLKAGSIRNGMVVWTEDASALLRLNSLLEDRRTELSERNALLRLEYEKESEHQKTALQNHLYDLLQSSTKSQLQEIDSLARKYRDSFTGDRRRILRRILLLGSFVKRRKDLVLSSFNSELLDVERLERALNESCNALRQNGIRGSYMLQPAPDGSRLMDADLLCSVYDIFEAAAEVLPEKTGFLSFRMAYPKARLRISITTDAVLTEEQIRSLKRSIETSGAAIVNIECNEDGTQIICEDFGSVKAEEEVQNAQK